MKVCSSLRAFCFRIYELLDPDGAFCGGLAEQDVYAEAIAVAIRELSTLAWDCGALLVDCDCDESRACGRPVSAGSDGA